MVGGGGGSISMGKAMYCQVHNWDRIGGNQLHHHLS